MDNPISGNCNVSGGQSEHQSNLELEFNMEKNCENIMPRCSSFQDFSSLSPNSETTDTDSFYIRFKSCFHNHNKQPVSVQNQCVRFKKGIHNMTSAIRGLVTPKGFPSYTDLKVKLKRSKRRRKRNLRDNFKDLKKYFRKFQQQFKSKIMNCFCFRANYETQI